MLLLVIHLILHFHVLALWDISHTVAAGSLASHTLSKIASHFLDLPLVFQVAVPVHVQLLFLEDRLLIKQPLGEGVILLLNSFSFSFSHSHVQTRGALKHFGLY